MSAAAPPEELETAEARPPLARHMVIQADQFCTCGYNLHSQRVSFDERLEFPVVRCPECGKWHPAGHGSTALRPWLARLATVALAAWVGLLLLVGLAIAGALIGFQVGYLEMQIAYGYVDPNTGRAIDQQLMQDGTWHWVYLDDGTVADNTARFSVQGVAVPLGDAAASQQWGQGQTVPWQVRFVLISVAAILGLVGGMIQAAAMWHVRGWRRFVPPLLVLGLSAGICWLALTMNHPYYTKVLHLARIGSLLILGTAAAGWLLGMLLGRPIFRTIVTALVPPRPRTMLAFLWLADSKLPPRASD